MERKTLDPQVWNQGLIKVRILRERRRKSTTIFSMMIIRMTTTRGQNGKR